MGGVATLPTACQLHRNIVSQDCDAQARWLKKKLKAVPQDDWLIVVGHHPADEIDVVDFTAILQTSPHHVDIYLNGHVR